MNSKTKRRMIAVAGVIVIVVIVLLAVVGSGSSAKVVSVSELAAGDYAGKKVKVSGLVVANSYEVDQTGVLTFDIQDEDGNGDSAVHGRYDKGVSATFGNGIKAICTGRVDEKGTVICSDLVTQCPSKYESASNALSVAQLLGYGESMQGKTTKVTGVVKAGTLADASQAVRFTLIDENAQEGGKENTEDNVNAATASDKDAESESLAVAFEGALPDQIADGVTVVVTGALSGSDVFLATDVSLGR